MDDRQEREARMKRSLGMSKEAKANLAKHLEAQTDWYTVCPKCGKRLSGTLSDIGAHRCDR